MYLSQHKDALFPNALVVVAWLVVPPCGGWMGKMGKMRGRFHENNCRSRALSSGHGTYNGDKHANKTIDPRPTLLLFTYLPNEHILQ